MEILGAFAGLLGLVAFIIGLLMFAPTAALKPKRKLARNIALGGFVAFVFGLIISPTPPAATIGADASKPVTATSDTTVAVAPPDVKKLLEAEAQQVWKAVIAAAEPCEQSSKKLAVASKTRDVYEMYPAATDGAAACRDASSQTRSLDPPHSAAGEVKAAFEKAIERCADGHLLRANAFEQVAKVLDGDARPSAVTEAQKSMEASSVSGMFCATEMFSAAEKGGLPATIFSKE